MNSINASRSLQNILAKAKAARQQHANSPKTAPHLSPSAPQREDVRDPMTTEEASRHLRVSKTTLRAYERSGLIRANRVIIPGKTRGKVTWNKSDLDKIK